MVTYKKGSGEPECVACACPITVKQIMNFLHRLCTYVGVISSTGYMNMKELLGPVRRVSAILLYI